MQRTHGGSGCLVLTHAVLAFHSEVQNPIQSYRAMHFTLPPALLTSADSDPVQPPKSSAETEDKEPKKVPKGVLFPDKKTISDMFVSKVRVVKV